MLIAPPLEIIDLLEDIYDEDGNFVEEKLSDSATSKQRELFEQYQSDCKGQLEKYNNQFKIKHS